MFMYFFSIVIIVASNVFYNICQKSTPQKVNPFAALFVTYLSALLLTGAILIFDRSEKNFIDNFKGINWTSYVLGICIFGLEFGYLMAYRAGWNISIGSLVANIILAILLIPIGIIVYKEGFDLNRIIGAAFCIIGLLLINKK